MVLGGKQTFGAGDDYPDAYSWSANLYGQFAESVQLEIDQKSVRNALGEPMTSQGPVMLPGGRGKRGGSDTYRLSSETHPNAKVTLGYLENLAVNNISFSLIDKGHD